MSTSTKQVRSHTAFRVIVGTLTGGVLMGLTFATFSTILLYGIAKTKAGGSPAFGWVTTIATLEFVMGLVLGSFFGLLLSLANRGRVVGAIAGIVVSIVPLWIWLSDMVLAGLPYWRSFLMATVPPACGLVGLVTSFAISRVSRRQMQTTKAVG
jgi:hypothetical protein